MPLVPSIALDLRCLLSSCPNKREKLTTKLTLRHLPFQRCTLAQVRNFDIIFIVKYNVLTLQITVTYPIRMQFSETQEDLLKYVSGSGLGERTHFHDIVKELPLGGRLHNRIDNVLIILIRPEDPFLELLQPEYIGVLKLGD